MNMNLPPGFFEKKIAIQVPQELIHDFVWSYYDKYHEDDKSVNDLIFWCTGWKHEVYFIHTGRSLSALAKKSTKLDFFTIVPVDEISQPDVDTSDFLDML